MYDLNSIDGIIVGASFVSSRTYEDGMWLIYGERAGYKYFWPVTSRATYGAIITDGVYDIYVYYI